jgi:hypothetical protein
MKPQDVYDAPFLRETREVYGLSEFLDGVDCSNEGLDNQVRVNLRTHFSPYIDGTRHATMQSIWFDDKPVMIVKHGGRPDREHSHRYITDLPAYKEMVGYLKSMEEIEEYWVEQEVFEADQDVEDLDRVYTYQIEPTDLGPIPHARYRFKQWLREWSSEHAWPYPASFPGWSMKEPQKNRPTLVDKQGMRWPRIVQEAASLAKADPASSDIRSYAESYGNAGDDAAIETMMQMLDSLVV